MGEGRRRRSTQGRGHGPRDRAVSRCRCRLRDNLCKPGPGRSDRIGIRAIGREGINDDFISYGGRNRGRYNRLRRAAVCRACRRTPESRGSNALNFNKRNRELIRSARAPGRGDCVTRAACAIDTVIDCDGCEPKRVGYLLP